jgi:hypothetical protein
MRVFGALLISFGLLISLSIVGAIIGLPMILVGIVCLIAGGRRNIQKIIKLAKRKRGSRNGAKAAQPTLLRIFGLPVTAAQSGD